MRTMFFESPWLCHSLKWPIKLAYSFCSVPFARCFCLSLLGRSDFSRSAYISINRTGLLCTSNGVSVERRFNFVQVEFGIQVFLISCWKYFPPCACYLPCGGGT